MALDQLVDSTQLNEAMTATANAIREKTGDTATITWDQSTGFADAIADISTEEEVGEGRVVFYDDLDHRVVKRYTPEQFAALTEMPRNPEHEGFTSQGWNWDLASAQEYVAKYKMLNIGQMYIPSDNNTHIIIELTGNTAQAKFFYMSTMEFQGENSSGDTLHIRWGDGYEEDIHHGSQGHQYLSPGTYEIVVETATMPNTSYVRFYYAAQNYPTSAQSYYAGKVKAVHLGRMSIIGSNGLYGCVNLETVTVPDVYDFGGSRATGDTTIGSCAFGYCHALKSFTAPRTISRIEGSAFSNTDSLNFVSFPSVMHPEYGNQGTFYLGNEIFSNSYSLRSITFPHRLSTTTSGPLVSSMYNLKYVSINSSYANFSIGNTFRYCGMLTEVFIGEDFIAAIPSYAFDQCKTLFVIHMMCATPPAISGSPFANLPQGFRIYVPAESVETYRAASGWSNYSSNIEAEPT